MELHQNLNQLINVVGANYKPKTIIIETTIIVGNKLLIHDLIENLII